MRVHETIYKQAGAVHGCALATNKGDTAQILMFVEDVGRHNAVDAIAGRMWLTADGATRSSTRRPPDARWDQGAQMGVDRLEGGDKIFYTTGRLTSEMVIKAAQMEIPFLVSRSGLTQMGYDIAQKVGLTMIGRAMNKHYLLFTGAQRFLRHERVRANVEQARRHMRRLSLWARRKPCWQPVGLKPDPQANGEQRRASHERAAHRARPLSLRARPVRRERSRRASARIATARVAAARTAPRS